MAAYVYTGDYVKAIELFDRVVGSGGKQASAVVRDYLVSKVSVVLIKINRWRHQIEMRLSMKWL
ncbi:MAG: hypothetical protein R3E95_16550 [Thiolinea sp.]